MGYFSGVYKKIYYDGYGLNFYNGKYGYYEFSNNPIAITRETLIAIVVSGILFIIISGALTWRFVENNSKFLSEPPEEKFGSEYALEENNNF